jgi:hypothetical protein
VQQFLNSIGDEAGDYAADAPLSSAALSTIGPPLPHLQRPPSDSSVPSSLASYSSAHFGLSPLASLPLPFSRLLKHLSRPSLSRPILVSFSLQAMNSATCPGVFIRSSNGLTVEEALEICSASGSDPNVCHPPPHPSLLSVLSCLCPPPLPLDSVSLSQVHLFTVNELNPLIEEPRSASLSAELIYWFLLGYTNRRPKAFLPSQQPPNQPLYRTRSSNRSPMSRSPLNRSPLSRSPLHEYDLSQQDMLLATSMLNLSDGHDL